MRCVQKQQLFHKRLCTEDESASNGREADKGSPRSGSYWTAVQGTLASKLLCLNWLLVWGSAVSPRASEPAARQTLRKNEVERTRGSNLSSMPRMAAV